MLQNASCGCQEPAVSTWPNMRTSMEVWMPSQWVTASSPSSPPSARRPPLSRSCCSPSSHIWHVVIWVDRSASHSGKENNSWKICSSSKTLTLFNLCLGLSFHLSAVRAPSLVHLACAGHQWGSPGLPWHGYTSIHTTTTNSFKFTLRNINWLVFYQVESSWSVTTWWPVLGPLWTQHAAWCQQSWSF